MVRKLGLIAFANDGGLGAQTRRLAKLLNPERVMVIDSSGFSRNRAQHFEWYKDYPSFIATSFPISQVDVDKFLQNLTHVLCVENPYNFNLVWYAQKKGIKIYCQSNYEFNDNLDKPYLPVVDKFLMPSHWKLAEMKELFGEDRVMYLPPPIDPAELQTARQVNLKRRGKKRFLHVIGTAAHLDRNGTLDLVDTIPLTKGDFELIVRSQHNLSMDVFVDDPRVKYEVGNLEKNEDLYKDFDALLLPRRWGGLSLTANEALMAGLPVLMSDVSPQKSVLPAGWLCPANRQGSFVSHGEIPYYSVSHSTFGAMIDAFSQMSDEVMLGEKQKAFEIAMNYYSPDALKERYLNLFNDGKS